MSMRVKVITKKEEIAKNDGLVDTTPEGVGKQLEEVFDAMLEVHKEYIDTANAFYLDFFNWKNDENYVPELGQHLYASVIVNYKDLRMFAPVEISNIMPTGIVEFIMPDKSKGRLYADELINYRQTMKNVQDTRDLIL